MEPYRILITGSRDWDDTKAIERALSKYVMEDEDGFWEIPERFTLISGACPTGADRLCEEFWGGYNGTLDLYPADWDKYGKRAGFVRNAEMVALQPDICYAFIKNNSKGATMTADLAAKKDIEVVTFRA